MSLIAESGNQRSDPDLREGTLVCHASSESAGHNSLLPGADPNSAAEAVAPTCNSNGPCVCVLVYSAVLIIPGVRSTTAWL